MIRRWTRRLRDEDAGLSLTEVIVAAVVSVLVLALAGGIFAQTAKVATGSNTTQQSTRMASNATNALTQTIRMAFDLPVSGSTPDPAIASGTPSGLTIYSTSDTVASAPAPSRFVYTLTSAGALTESRCTGTPSGVTWTFGSCSVVTRTVASGLLSGGTVTPLFQYYSRGSQVTPGSGGLTLAQRTTIDSITVTVTVGSNERAASRVVVSSPVIMVNLDRPAS